MTKEVNLEISGDESSMVAALGRARAAVTESTASMRSTLSGVTESFKGLTEGFGAFAAVLAGGAAFKEIITQTKEITAESLRLGKSLGIATSEASTYAVAMNAVGGDSQDFADASRGLTRQLKTNEKGLNDMGIATRDASGNLRNAKDIMWDAIETVNSYTVGTDRNLAAQTAFGRGASANSAILKLHKEDLEEAAKDATDLGLVVGQENVQAYAENKKATAAAMDTLKGMEKAIGDALLPVLTKLAEWFRDIGPAAIVVIKGAVGGLVAVFWSLWAVANIVIDYVELAFHTVADTAEELFQAAGAAISGHMGEAAQHLRNIPKVVKADWHVAFDAMAADAQTARDKIMNLFADPTLTNAPKPGKSFNLEKKEKEGPDTRFEEYKNSLDRMRQAADDYDHKDISADMTFWQQKLAITTGGTKQDEKLRAEINRTILGLQKKAHDEEIKQQEEALKQIESIQLGEIEAKRQTLSQEFALGNISRRQEAQASIQLENEKFHIQQEALQKRLALSKFDLLGQQKLKDEELKLEQKHALDVQKIIDKEALAESKTWDNLFGNMRSGFQTTIASFLKGTSSMSGAIKGLFSDITGSVINSLAQMAAKNLEVMLMSLVMGKTAALAQIKQSAAAAGAGAYKAVVGIPYVGPFLAPAAAAVAYGATLAFGASASAAGGYDIPSNVNPIVQTHASEMILPKEHADTIRALSAGSGRAAGGTTINLSAVDARSIYKMLVAQGNSGPLGTSLRNLSRRFPG